MNKYEIALKIACETSKKSMEQCLVEAEDYIRANEVTILFTTDIHAQNQKLDIVKNRKMELVENKHNVLLVDSGDINEKTKDITLSMNGYYDCVTGGNHDGVCNGQNFMKRVEEADFTYLSFDLIKNDIPVLQPYKIYEFPCMKIGFIGWSLLNIGSGKWDGAKTKRDPLLLKKYVDEIRNDVDYIVLLLHNGEDEAKKILKKVGGIDIILGGHTHKIVNKTLPDVDGKQVIFAEAGHRLNCYGELAINDSIQVEIKEIK